MSGSGKCCVMWCVKRQYVHQTLRAVTGKRLTTVRFGAILAIQKSKMVANQVASFKFSLPVFLLTKQY
jgi:hypothetical protein